jgi:general secretion pathway protein A
MYERFFGLVDAPFRLTPDPRYLFLSEKHAEALAHLRLGLSESSGFVCITGDVGTGKTTLLRGFLAGLGPEWSTAYVFNPALTPLELLQTVNAELGLPAAATSPKVLIDALNAHLLAQREAGRRSIVVIDEAQALSIDVLEQLRLLSNLETATEKLLRIVLVGQPQLRGLLLHPELVQLNQRITLRWHMGPLAPRETVAYVRHRLGVAGAGKGTCVFTHPALRLLHRYSRGVPRLINMIAHRAMLAAFAADRQSVGARSVLGAYREIGAVPLTASAPPPAPAHRAAWAAAAGLAVSIGVIALGAPRFGWLPWGGPPATERDVTAGADALAPPVPVASRVPPIAESPPEPAPPAAPAPPQVSMAPPASLAAPAPAPPAPDAPEVATRLAALGEEGSARAAMAALLAAWHVAPLGADERAAPADFAAVAERRGLEYLALRGNRSMLRVLDLPAVLELHLPETPGRSFVTLTGLDGDEPVLAIDGTPTRVDPTFAERHWFGQAHLFWRDFEALGVTFGPETHGAQVARLQTLLGRAGAYAGPVTGVYDDATAAAVRDFQRSRFLATDGLVGRLTRIVLYAAAGGYSLPTLATTGGAAS